MALDRETIKEVLESLEKMGISFILWEPKGPSFVILSPDSVLEFREKEAEQFWADQYGVSLEHYQSWLDFRKNPYCHGVNRKGDPCKIRPDSHLWNNIISNPANFDPEYDIYCQYHKPYGGIVK
jgi:hypothetical protein